MRSKVSALSGSTGSSAEPGEGGESEMLSVIVTPAGQAHRVLSRIRGQCPQRQWWLAQSQGFRDPHGPGNPIRHLDGSRSLSFLPMPGSPHPAKPVSLSLNSYRKCGKLTYLPRFWYDTDSSGEKQESQQPDQLLRHCGGFSWGHTAGNGAEDPAWIRHRDALVLLRVCLQPHKRAALAGKGGSGGGRREVRLYPRCAVCVGKGETVGGLPPAEDILCV